MNSPQKSPFLDVKSYRRKRLIDAARMLPVLGAAVLVFPLPFLFFRSLDTANAATLAIFFFVVWLILILGAGVLARLLRGPGNDD